MKCHCKYCSPKVYCQTIDENDFCYYRHSIKANGTNDFGCIQHDTARFFCNRTDAHYRTECCSSFFCNTDYNNRNGSITSTTPSIGKMSLENGHNHFLGTIIVVITLFVLVLLGVLGFCSYKRKFKGLWLSSLKSTNLTDDENSSSKRSKKKSSYFSSNNDPESDVISWKSESFDENNRIISLQHRRVNKEITFFGQLGQGRHARVRLGLFGQQYRAIKMYETRFQNEFERERTIFETDLIQHPNILAFFGADFFAKGAETCYMLIFEWHPYGTLYDVLKENKNQKFITIEQLFQYSISICDGVTHLHSIKYGTNDVCKPQMAHCDIKSSNILVKSNGDCCLSDFSLAVRCDPHTNVIQGGGIERIHHRVGTKLYMPPELLDKNSQFHFDRINAYQQADVYSTGLVLWEIGNCCCTMQHIRPYENQLPVNFNVEQLIQLVCIEKRRPKTDENISDEILIRFFELLDLYWCQDPCERHSAANLQDQLRQLHSQTIF